MPPTGDDDLKLTAKDVAYEVQMLFEAKRLLGIPAEDGARRLIFEALLLHFRNIIDFFYTDSHNRDDVRACDFFPGPAQWKPEVPDWYREYKARCNKLLAHLTYSRTDFKRRNRMTWHLTDKLRDIQGAWRLFLRTLPPERAAWFT